MIIFSNLGGASVFFFFSFFLNEVSMKFNLRKMNDFNIFVFL